ncbi:MAG: Cu(I)-responsive transcriptional regulator [Alphaproteobacteria bacterium]|jgi:Cu(I)-responsive transcriptional regulator|nr:Cu(I)-responsive transcriptional regulator [Alphaproteobacteria bacterium]
MNIGQAGKQSGLSAKTIRYYEEVGLVVPERRANGYRAYDPRDVHKLRFLQRARNLGFSIDDCRALLSLYEDRERASADVKGIAEAHLAAIDDKITDLQSLRGVLAHLIHACHGDERPDCPILDDLAGEIGPGH